MVTPNPAPDLYDEEEWEMISSFEDGELAPVPEAEEELRRHKELIRAARLAGKYGPVDYDKPYPWSKKNQSAKSPPLADDTVSSDNPQPKENI